MRCISDGERCLEQGRFRLHAQVPQCINLIVGIVDVCVVV